MFIKKEIISILLSQRFENNIIKKKISKKKLINKKFAEFQNPL